MVNQAFDVYAKEIRQCKSRNYLKEPISLRRLVEPDQSNMIYRLSMINHMLCMV